jgi:hypothetical protein
MFGIITGAVSFVVIVSILSYVTYWHWETVQHNRHYSRNLQRLVEDINHNDGVLQKNDKRIMNSVKDRMVDVQKVLTYQQHQMDTINQQMKLATQRQDQSTSVLTPAALESRDSHLKALFKAEQDRLAKQIDDQQVVLKTADTLAKNNDALLQRHTEGISALKKEDARLDVDLTALSTRVNTQDAATQEGIRQLKAADAAFNTNLSALGGKVDGIQSQQTSLNTSMTSLQTDVGRQLKAADTNLVNLGGRVDSIRGEVTGLQTDVARIAAEKTVSAVSTTTDTGLGKHITVTGDKGVVIDATNTDINGGLLRVGRGATDKYPIGWSAGGVYAGTMYANGTIGAGTNGQVAASIDNNGVVRGGRVQLGNKWQLSGTGDAIGNDDWLRVMDKDGKNYYGGVAMNKAWVGGDGWVNNLSSTNMKAFGDATVDGKVNANRVQLGKKWMLSGVGDGIGNDDWLRVTRTDGKDYYGGLATGKMWVGGNGWVGNLATQKVQLGNKWVLSGVGDGIGNDDWLRFTRLDGRDYYGGLAMGKAWVGRDAWINEVNSSRVCMGGNCLTGESLNKLKRAGLL